MENFNVDHRKKAVYFKGKKMFWWKLKHNRSTSSEEAIDIRAWYMDSKKYGYLPDDEKLKISAIRKLEERQGGEPIDWIPAEHRIRTPESLHQLNKFVDLAEKEQLKQESQKHKAASDLRRDQEEHAESHPETEGDRSMKPPSFERIDKNQLKCGKFIWHRNEDGSWYRIPSPNSKTGKPVSKKYWDTLDQILSELADPRPEKNPNTSSKRKRPKFTERNKHGGLIIHGLVNSSYYTRFDIGRSKKYPKGYTFRMNRGKFFLLETMDREGLAAIEKEIAAVLQS